MFMPESDNPALVPSGIPSLDSHPCMCRRQATSWPLPCKSKDRVEGQGLRVKARLFVAVGSGVFVAAMLVSVIFLCRLLNVGETFVRLFGRKLLSIFDLTCQKVQPRECQDGQLSRLATPKSTILAPPSLALPISLI